MYTDPASWQMSYKNAAEARLWGIELETMLRPLTGLQITGSFGLLESEFTEHETHAYVGNHVPLAPAYQAGLSAQYISPWGLSLRAEGIWTGKSYFGEDNLYSQDDYVIANARIGYQIDTFGIFFYMKNAFDKTYYTFANSRGGVDKGILGVPRTFGVQATLRF
jgi:outer membrane receptor protein involved in Fe transport